MVRWQVLRGGDSAPIWPVGRQVGGCTGCRRRRRLGAGSFQAASSEDRCAISSSCRCRARGAVPEAEPAPLQETRAADLRVLRYWPVRSRCQGAIGGQRWIPPPDHLLRQNRGDEGARPTRARCRLAGSQGSDPRASSRPRGTTLPLMMGSMAAAASLMAPRPSWLPGRSGRGRRPTPSRSSARPPAWEAGKRALELGSTGALRARPAGSRSSAGSPHTRGRSCRRPSSPRAAAPRPGRAATGPAGPVRAPQRKAGSRSFSNRRSL